MQRRFTPALTTADVPVIFVSREAGYGLFDEPGFDINACLAGDGSVEAPIEIGAVGDLVTDVGSTFDGWGYVHLYLRNADNSLTELDTFAIDEAHDPDFATGFGDLTVHEVATDPQDPSLAYLSYYSGGLRAVQIQCSDPADTSTCELVEVGGYLDPEGNDFWGVEVIPNPADDPDVQGDEVLILASDRDYGLFIFRDP